MLFVKTHPFSRLGIVFFLGEPVSLFLSLTLYFFFRGPPLHQLTYSHRTFPKSDPKKLPFVLTLFPLPDRPNPLTSSSSVFQRPPAFCPPPPPELVFLTQLPFPLTPQTLYSSGRPSYWLPFNGACLSRHRFQSLFPCPRIPFHSRVPFFFPLRTTLGVLPPFPFSATPVTGF